MAILMKKNGQLVSVGMPMIISDVLNLYIRTYSNLPLSGRENEIAVITKTPMNKYIISMNEPNQQQEGNIWVKTVQIGGKQLNVVEPNYLIINIGEIYQYISNVWVKKVAYIYQNNEWSTFSQYLYSPGNIYSDLTGGWSSSGYRQSSGSPSGGAGITDNYMYCTGVYATYEGCIGTAYAIDLTNYSTLYFDAECTTTTNAVCRIVSNKNNFNSYTVASKSLDSNARKTYSIDISSINASRYILFTSSNESGTTKIYNVWCD